MSFAGRNFLSVTLVGLLLLAAGAPLRAQDTAFMQAVAEAAAGDRDVAAFYKAAGYEPLWTGRDRRDRQRRQALLRAVSEAGDHGLPAGRYDPELIETDIRAVRNVRDLGRLEVALSRVFLRYARDIQTGMLTPSRIDREIDRDVPVRSRRGMLEAFAQSTPAPFIRALPPQTDEYKRLLKEKLRLEEVVGAGGWGGEVPEGRLELGDAGPGVVALRNRLIRMGFLRRTSRTGYDENIRQAVARFQRDHGLRPDGVVGPATLAEMNRPATARLASVMVAMERERWMNHPDGRGTRHVWVNLPDFRMRLYERGRVIFETKAVVGERRHMKRTPEFSDTMEYMEINPDWTVPRSILGRDYLPKFQENRFAAQYLQLIDDAGRVIPREAIDFSQYTEETFPFTVRQPPGRSNALGTVKFMFPNRHAVYLHDTPERHLFQRDLRAYSSGCVRLNDPHDFAYNLLKGQVSDPVGYFQGILASQRQTLVPLDRPLPVHLVYRTAFTEPKGRVQFRRDIYGRDAKIWAAMQELGVALRAVRG